MIIAAVLRAREQPPAVLRAPAMTLGSSEERESQSGCRMTAGVVRLRASSVERREWRFRRLERALFRPRRRRA